MPYSEDVAIQWAYLLGGYALLNLILQRKISIITKIRKGIIYDSRRIKEYV